MNAERAIGAMAVRQARSRDAERVEAFVRTTRGGTPFHLPQWLGAVERGCGQDAICLIAEDVPYSVPPRRRGHVGHIVGVLPLTLVHSPLFGRALVSTGFAVGGGILASDDETAEALADTAWQLAESLSCTSVELRGGRVPAGWQFRDGIYANFTRPLAAGDEAELAAIPRKQRAEVRRALAQDFAILTGRSQAEREAHYAVYAESVRNLGTPVFPRVLFEAVLDAFGEDADILTVHHDGKAVASVLSLYFDGAVMPYWGGGTFAARGLRANEAMYFALMRHARARGCTRFDFGRSKLGTGAYAYKKNWGFAPQPLTYAVRTTPDGAPREINPLDPKYSLQVELWRRLPLWAANRLGPLIARGLG